MQRRKKCLPWQWLQLRGPGCRNGARAPTHLGTHGVHWEEELALVCHLRQSVDTSGGLLTHTHHDDSPLGPRLGVHTAGVRDCLKDALELWVGGAGWILERAILGELVLEILTLVDEHGGITSVIDDLVRAISTRPRDHLLHHQFSARVSPLHALKEEVESDMIPTKLLQHFVQ